MKLVSTFIPLEASEIASLALEKKQSGWRYSQMHCVMDGDNVNCIYSFIKDGKLENYVVEAAQKHMPLKSISSIYFSAFVFENESHDLFGIDFEGLVLDFSGSFYQTSITSPMTIISPEQKRAREKAAVREVPKKADASLKTSTSNSYSASDLEAEIKAKTAGLNPEKAAKIEAALRAKFAKAQNTQPREINDLDALIAEKTRGLDPDKAAKIEAALRLKHAKEQKATSK